MTIEITVRDLSHMDSIFAQLDIIRPSRIHLTDKTGLPDNLEIARMIKSNLPACDIMPHYAMHNHTSRDPQRIQNQFDEYISNMIDIGIKQVLIISGSKRPKFDSLAALDRLDYLAAHDSRIKKMRVAVAYNPFLNSPEREIEEQRLETKISHANVDTIILQIGSLHKPLKSGIVKAQSIKKDIKVMASLIMPTAQFLAKFRQNPWKGVYLDDKYLSNVSNAIHRTWELKNLMEQYGAEPVIEIPSITSFNYHEYKAFFDINT